MMTAPYLDTHKAIIGTSGAGKTVTAKDEVETLLRDRRHLCILDPTGAWWGLRSNADGDGPGFDIPIFGGDHGDVPIAPEQGEAVGNIIAGGVSAIVDVSSMDGRDQRRFVLGLMRALRRKPKGNFHLIVDEADEFAPQTAPDDFGFQLAEQMAWVAKRGRLAGFVLTAVTQRPADITKAVLSQVQTIIAHQLIAPQDQKAIDDYLKANGDAATRKTVMASLAGLARGERWIYSPRLGLLDRGVTPMPSTFDSSRTPEPGETPVEPKMLAQIDLGAIREALAPKESELANDLPAAHNSDEILKLRERVTQLESLLRGAEAGRDQARDELYAALEWQKRIRAAVNDTPTVDAPVRATAPVVAREPVPARDKPVAASKPPRAAPADGSITGPQQRILDALAWWEAFGVANPTNDQVGFVAGYSPGSGNFNNLRGQLRSAGMIDYPAGGRVSLTEEGRAAAKRPDTPPTRGAFHAAVRAKLKQPQLRLLDPALGAYPKDVSVDDLAAVSGYSAGSGNFNNLRGSLRTLDLIAYPRPGHVRASDWLFP